MHFVLIHSIVQSTRRAKQRLLDNLQPPSATEPRIQRRDRTGLVMSLVVITLVIAFVLLA